MTRATTLDLIPLQKFAVGFDQLFSDMDRLYMNSATSATYPPYNIVKFSDDEFLISFAVAGFKMDELEVTHTGNVLTIEGSIPEIMEQGNFIHKGIATRSFRRIFTIADHMEVENAKLDSGILDIYLKRNIPEHLQPRKIQITES
jgi:molecular chaperone IbpA